MKKTVTVILFLSLLIGFSARAADTVPVTPVNSITNGQRVFTCGHSFHFWLPPILKEMAESAGIAGHQIVGLSKIGGSQVIQHWNVPDEKNEAKAALRAGRVDVLTLSPMHNPDIGIDKFAELGQQGNPNIRVTISEFWMPWDKNEWPFKGKPESVDNNAMTAEGLDALHDPYFAKMDEYVRGVNAKAGRQELFVVPVGQAVVALRKLIIAGKVPGIARQSDLFADKLGHPKAAIQALAGYCHFAVIYRRSPIGLPMPSILKGAAPKWNGDAAAEPAAQKSTENEQLNRLLQELAWKAVTQHPLSGISPSAN